jgi:hypothetical protein
MAPRRRQDEEEGLAGITGTGVRKCAWFHQDEAEALRQRAFQERRSEAALIREAVRRLLGIED